MRNFVADVSNPREFKRELWHKRQLYHIMTPMLISLLFESPVVFVILAGILIISLTIHEFAHAYITDKLGDPTPRAKNRVTLNPLAHLDPLGTAALFLIGFGWGKPVPFDPYNLKNPVKDAGLISFAGPGSNLLLALLLAIVYKLGLLGFLSSIGIEAILQYAISINVVLAVFNLVPIYPLDGEKILVAVLPKVTAIEYEQFMRRYGTYLLLFLILPWNGVSPLSQLISPVINLVIGWLI